VNDFSPEQLQNLICVVNLYRGNNSKFKQTVASYLNQSCDKAKKAAEVEKVFQQQFDVLYQTVLTFAQKLLKDNPEAQSLVDSLTFEGFSEVKALQDKLITDATIAKADQQILETIAQLCKALRKPQDKLIKHLLDAISNSSKALQLNKNKDWKDLGVKELIDALKATQMLLSGNPDEEEPGFLHETEYYWKQSHWLTSRFPDGKYTDVEGLCKIVSQSEIEAKDWSLSPGRYVGVDTNIDEDFDYEERLAEIHIELEGLNDEAFTLAKIISENYKELAI
jgi:type I restriction enzyme M protein